MGRSLLSFQTSNTFRLRASPSPYICTSCSRQALRQHNQQPQLVRHASSSLPFTERLRRKIWGTDNPPGLPDPYGGPGYFERRRQQAREEREASAPVSAPAPAAPPPQSAITQPEQVPDVQYQTAMDDIIPLRSVPENDPKTEDPNYVPAENWDGLEHVGLSGHWSEMPPRPEESFRPFLATFEKAVHPEEFLSSIHQAVVEVITLQNSALSWLSDLADVTYSPEALASISSIDIDVDDNGKQMVLRYHNAAKASIIEALHRNHEKNLRPPDLLENAEVEEERLQMGEDLSSAHDGSLQHVQVLEMAPVAPRLEEDQNRTVFNNREEVKDRGRKDQRAAIEEVPRRRKRIPYTVTSLDFLRVPLEPTELRFPIFKRLSQLTGHRIPDHLLTSKTLMPIYKYLSRHSTPKHRKLADHLLVKQDLVTLPNVHIMSRRETPVDKDKGVGRWKIIESELRSKGLPVLSKSGV